MNDPISIDDAKARAYRAERRRQVRLTLLRAGWLGLLPPAAYGTAYLVSIGWHFPALLVAAFCVVGWLLLALLFPQRPPQRIP